MALLEALVAILFFSVIYLIFKNLQWKFKFEKRVDEFLKSKEESIRRDAIDRSARTLSGKTLEKLVPFLESFPYDPHDIRWLGDPIDLVIFDGYSAEKPDKIVFCEVKSGESKLTAGQKRIKELIEGKKVKWEEFRVQ
jgi:predicted Holliday junction resolvase-like endonuclease